MSPQERNELGILFANLAEYYSKNLTRGALAMYIEDLEEYPLGQIQLAMKKYRQDTKNRTFPVPAQLIEIMNPKTNSRNEAMEAASRITEAVSYFGYTNPERAKEYIGDLGWRIVSRIGGWQYLCENLGVTLHVSTFQAQARDIALSTIERGNAGLDGFAPQLPQAEKITELFSSSNDMKLLT